MRDLLYGLPRWWLFRDKVWVFKNFSSSRTFGGIVLEHGNQQFKCCTCQLFLVLFRKHVWFSVARPQQLEPRHLDEVGPVGPVGCPENGIDLFQLTYLASVPREDGAFCKYLHHHTSGAPDVDRWAVLRLAKQQLGRPVPYRDDAVGIIELMVFGVEACQTKVGKFENSLVADK